MNLHLRVAHARFGFLLASDLEEKKLGTVTLAVEPVERFALHYRPTLSLRQVSGLLEALTPLVPEEVTASGELPPEQDAVLWLGEPGGARDHLVHVHSDSPVFAARLRDQLAGLGYNPRIAAIQDVQEDVVLSYGQTRFSQQVFRWSMAHLGLTVASREDGNYSGCFGLFLRDPQSLGKPASQRFAVEVACDDPELGQGLIELLEQRRFSRCTLTTLTEYEADTLPFVVYPGPFTGDRYPTEYSRLQGALQESFQKYGIDPNRFPIQVDGSYMPNARLVAPLGAARSARKIAYAGPYSERFHVTIVTDEAAGVENLKNRLRDVGFRKITVQERKSLLDGPDDGSAGEFQPGYAVAWNEAGQYANVTSMLMGTARAEMNDLGAKNFTLRRYDSCSGDSTTVRLYFPVRGAGDGSLLDRIADPSRFRLRVLTPRPDGWKGLISELRNLKFAGVDLDTTNQGDPTLCYGGAPPELLDRMKGIVKKYHGNDPGVSKNWDDTFMEVYLYLPDRQPSASDQAVTPDIPEEMATQIEVWAFGDAGGESIDSFIEVTADRVRIGNILLPRHQGPRHELAPHPASFSHFCLDRLTAATLEHIATSVLLREPCLLEGETSTSKTSSVLFLASLLNQPVARINLNGQTDTGELIGRFVPQHLILELPMGEQELYAAVELLEAETRMILEKARRENRSLTRLEVQQIMAQEEMTSHPWRWQDGLVPQAMRHGWWILLDEVNLAEPQILERLNSALETDPCLVLTENDNSVIGLSGSPVHGGFRIFGTMNPAEYAGRSVLSPAYRDRWRGYRFVPRPGEGEFLDMLRLLVFGEQPDFGLHGSRYLGPDQEPRYRHLTALPNVDNFLEALARFHVALEHAVGQNPNTMARIGGRRKERYVFTRRGLLSMLDYLSSPLSGDGGALDTRSLRKALLRYYLGRLSSAEDRAMVVQLLDAHGLGPNTWKFD